jgi:hypothetical protein
MSMINNIVMIIYHLLSAVIVLLLLRSIWKTKDIQEAILYCVILIPFVLRVVHIK